MTKFLWPINLTGNTINDFRIENLTNAPTSGKAGRVVFLTSTSRLALDTGSGFIPILSEVSWNDITGKPSTFTPSAHTHEISDVNGLAAALASTSISDGSITNIKLANMANATVKGRTSPGTGVPEDLTMSQLKTLLALATGDISGLTAALAAKANTFHTHVASDVTDLNTTIDGRVAAYWGQIAGTDANVDTIRELLDLVLLNQSSLQNIIGRHNQTIGDGTSTSIQVTHNLNSLDISVEIYEISTGETVIANISRTNSNVITVNTAFPIASNSLRVVIKK